MEAKDDNHIRLTEGVNRRLGYAQKFKDMIHEHPGILRTALRLTQKAEDDYNPPNIRIEPAELQWNKEKTEFEVIKHGDRTLEEPMSYGDFIMGTGIILVAGKTLKNPETGLEITALGKRSIISRRRKEVSSYFKMQLKDKSFFVKKSLATAFPGYEEFKSSIKARELLNGIEDLETVDAQLGYRDNHRSWFVSKWQNLEDAGFLPLDVFEGGTPDYYGKFPERQEIDNFYLGSEKFSKKVASIVKQIKIRSTAAGINIFDIEGNLFINPKTGKLFLLDITDFGGTDTRLNQQ